MADVCFFSFYFSLSAAHGQGVLINYHWNVFYFSEIGKIVRCRIFWFLDSQSLFFICIIIEEQNLALYILRYN